MIKAIFSDFDGTLRIHDSSVSDEVKMFFKNLKQNDVIRIIVTGRSLQSFLNAAGEDFPIDYLIFSSGAGVVDWKTKKLIYEKNLLKEEIDEIISHLFDENHNFMLHEKIPDSHIFYYHKSREVDSDFHERIEDTKGRSFELKTDKIPFPATQFIVTLNKEEEHLYDKLHNHLEDYSVIRTTSPYDYKSIWVEIFPKGIAKGSACEWLIERINLKDEECIALGNDFNDESMLDLFSNSYISSLAPNELRSKYMIFKNANVEELLNELERIIYFYQ